MFSYLAKEQMDLADLETFEEGDAIHLRRKSTQETFDIADEKRLFMELYEKRRVEIRSQWQHAGFWGTAPRNDGKRFNYEFPQCPDDHIRAGKPDTWPRMYTKEWLNA